MMITNGLPALQNLRTAVTMTSIILLIQILTAVMTGIPETAGIPEQQTGIVTGNYRIQRSTYGTYTYSPRTVLFIHTRMRKHTNTVTHIPTLTITKAQRQF